MRNKNKLIGKVQYVDTGSIIIKVDDENILNDIQVNQIIKIQSTKTNEDIMGTVSKIIRKCFDLKDSEDNIPDIMVENSIKVNLVGTWFSKVGKKSNVFKRTLNTIPSINAECFLLQERELSHFMSAISFHETIPLKIGTYTISEQSDANLNGNKFFQRHAVIVGGTGSGKSWAVAQILEKATKLSAVNGLVFDLHGEYKPLAELPNIRLLKIAGPSDNPQCKDVIFLPYWLLSYEEMEAMLLDRSDNNAPNQSRALFDLIVEGKKKKLENENKQDVLNNFTVESPIPYNIQDVLSTLRTKDTEMVKGKTGLKQGSLHGKLTRFIQRLDSKISDKRLNFLFNPSSELMAYDWLSSLMEDLLGFDNEKGLKIIDFSEVPSDILPLVTGLISRLVFSIQQWTDDKNRHPIAIFCDEAHLYIPKDINGSMEEKSLKSFERIAKEGRKYGISLVVISQRPSDINKTVLSQCGNFIAMRLTNPDDQNIIKKLFPDNLGDFSETLPILDIGEALIVGDASLLPSRVKIDAPRIKPNSATVDFWDEWKKSNKEHNIGQTVEILRKQQKN